MLGGEGLYQLDGVLDVEDGLAHLLAEDAELRAGRSPSVVVKVDVEVAHVFSDQGAVALAVSAKSS